MLLFKKLFENSLKYLLANKKNTLFIFPKADLKFNSNIIGPIKTFYEDVLNNNVIIEKDKTHNVIEFINIFPENTDDDIEIYKDKIEKDILRIEELIKKNAIKDSKDDKPQIIKNIIYFVDKDNNFFIDYYNTPLQKKYVEALNATINKFYSKNKINLQVFKRFSTVTKNLSNINKAYIIKEINKNINLEGKPDADKTEILKSKQFDNNIAILLNKLELFYQFRLDKSNKKKLSATTNSSIFNVFMRFNNIDNPIITNEIVANRNVLYVLKSANKNKIGHLTVINENKKHYKFIVSTIENKYYKEELLKKEQEEEKKTANKKGNSLKSKKYKTSTNTENTELEAIEKEIENAIVEGRNINSIEENKSSSMIIEIRYVYGIIQYRNIEKNLFQPWNTDNVIMFYKTINSYELYKFFNHRMIDNSFKDNIDINLVPGKSL
jgi:hypothetical protein